MSKNIIITEKQYKKILESTEETFSYINDNDDTKPYDGQMNITANGKLEPDENAKPTTSDEIQKSLTPQSWNRYRTYGNVTPRAMSEGVEIKQGNDTNQADDTGEVNASFNTTNKELNMLTDNNKDDNLVKIPQGVQDKINLLLDVVDKNRLSPKQKAIVLNKLIEELNTNSVPYRLQKKWKKDIDKNKDISNQWKNELEHEAD